MKIESLLDWPKPNYERIWAVQKDRVEAVVESAEETLFFCEHEPVITMGRRSHAANILDTQSISVFEIERGGDVTYHGPGQLVVYPILRLRGGSFRGGLHHYLRFLEEVTIEMLSDLGLESGRFGPTGVWIKRAHPAYDGDNGTRKIASIGIAVRRWVTYHGLALNVTNTGSDFAKIRPCDFESSIMTSLSDEGIHLTLKQAEDHFARLFLKNLEAQSRSTGDIVPSAEVDNEPVRPEVADDANFGIGPISATSRAIF